MCDSESDVADPGDTTLPPTTVTTTTTVPVVPGAVTVPDLSGRTLAEARQLLEEAGLEVETLPEDIDLAVVVAQEPAAGIEVAPSPLRSSRSNCSTLMATRWPNTGSLVGSAPSLGSNER